MDTQLAVHGTRSAERLVDDSPNLRWDRLEAEADGRPHTGPCLGCGQYRAVLFAGRHGGVRVYCDICAIATRTDSMKGHER